MREKVKPNNDYEIFPYLWANCVEVRFCWAALGGEGQNDGWVTGQTYHVFQERKLHEQLDFDIHEGMIMTDLLFT